MAVVVAIDGPAGSGKSTLARRLALELELPYLNTGLMYRAVARRALELAVSPDDGEALGSLAHDLRFELDPTVRPPSLVVDGRVPGEELTTVEVESTVSSVARHPQVRAVLRREQRRLIAGGAVVEGRDIGSVVAPLADVKLYLHASERERIGRRMAEREDDVGEALVRRDRADARTSPFVPPRDAVELDTTGSSARDVFERALAIVRDRLGPREPG